VVDIVNNATVPDVGRPAVRRCSTCCRLTTRSAPGCKLVEFSLITDQTGLYNRSMAARPSTLIAAWVSSVYVNYSQGNRTIQVAIADMGSVANAQAIYDYVLPASSVAVSGRDNAVVDMGLSTAYAAFAYLDRFYIELNITENPTPLAIGLSYS